MNVLVTGFAGLYGVHLVEELLKSHEVTRIYGIDDFSRGYPPEEVIMANPWGDKVQILKERFQDISVKDLNSLNLNAVIHLAGYNSRKESMHIPEEYFCNNEYGTFLFINKLLKAKNRPFLVYTSTTEVYGVPVYKPVDEVHPIDPQNLYSVTKVAAENHILAMSRMQGYPVVILRFTSTFGENQNICGYSSVISSFIDRALRNEPLIIYGSGQQKRDFLYVKDAVKAICLALVKRKEVEGKVINIATGRLTCINDLAQKVKDLTYSTSEIIELPGERGEPVGELVDTALAGKLLGWAAQYSLEQGLSRTTCWFKSLQSL